MKKYLVKGYKAFNKIKEFEFAPITLLIGKNGSSDFVKKENKDDFLTLCGVVVIGKSSINS